MRTHLCSRDTAHFPAGCIDTASSHLSSRSLAPPPAEPSRRPIGRRHSYNSSHETKKASPNQQAPTAHTNFSPPPHKVQRTQAPNTQEPFPQSSSFKKRNKDSESFKSKVVSFLSTSVLSCKFFTQQPPHIRPARTQICYSHHLHKTLFLHFPTPLCLYSVAQVELRTPLPYNLPCWM